MAHHKKRRSINARGHCKLCKYWKISGIGRNNPKFERHSDHKRRVWAEIEAKKLETWNEIADKILEERKEVWQALADYDEKGK